MEFKETEEQKIQREKEEAERREKEKAHQAYLQRIEDFSQDYYFLSGQLNWRCII